MLERVPSFLVVRAVVFSSLVFSGREAFNIGRCAMRSLTH